jgi:hypothetical protein
VQAGGAERRKARPDHSALQTHFGSQTRNSRRILPSAYGVARERMARRCGWSNNPVVLC